jgi:CRP/FNR family transcriptional regulator, cyclic AMP receptor protein
MKNAQPASRRRDVLGRHEFFSELPALIVDQLDSHARQATYRAGQRIFSKGDEGFGLLAVMSGLVKISVLAEDGREIALNMIGPNEIFGEIALFDGKPRTADATALIACELIILDRRDFLPLVAKHPAMAIKLLEILSSRLRRTTEQVEDLSFGNLKTRLAKTLLGLAEAQGMAASPQPKVEITQKELGYAIGLSRESTNRYLREWQEAGYVTLRKGACIINRRDRLAQLIANGAP